MTADKESVLSVRNLAKAYSAAGERVAVLRGVNLKIAAGERVALTGESGSGKSTLLHLIAGLDRPDGGEIDVAGMPISHLNEAGLAALRRDRLGLVFQQFNLLARTSATENVELPLLYTEVPARERRERARKALRAVGLRRNRYWRGDSLLHVYWLRLRIHRRRRVAQPPT